MLFGSPSANKNATKKKKRKKKLKQKYKEERLRGLRRTHIIIEARKKHERNRKTASKTLSKGGFTAVASMEDEDLGMRVATGIESAISMSGKAMAKFKSRQKSLTKSRNTHLAKLQAARSKMVARSRS